MVDRILKKDVSETQLRLYLRSWLSDASGSMGCISSCGEGVSVAVDWWL